MRFVRASLTSLVSNEKRCDDEGEVTDPLFTQPFISAA